MKAKQELAKTDYNGVTSRIRFDAQGDLTQGSITVYRAKAGQWQVLKTIESK